MSKRRIVLGALLAAAAALPLATPRNADARVFVGVGFGFPFFGVGFGAPFYAPYYNPYYPYYPYYPRPIYYPPPVAYPPPPVAYGAPPASYGTTAPVNNGPSAMARCVTGSIICPLRYVKPVGESCSCPDNAGRHVAGRVG